MSKLEITLFGLPQFKLDGQLITNSLPSKSQALLAYLAVTRQTHSREALVGLLWGEMSEKNARRNLRVALTKLRHSFDEYLVIQRRTLAFNRASDYWLDIDVFEACLKQPEVPVQQLQTAVSLYQGSFLAGLSLRTEARQGYALAAEAATHLEATAQHAYLLHQWGKAHIEQKDYTAVETILHQSQQIYQTLADTQGIAKVEATLARLALEQGDFERTCQHLTHSRQLRQTINDLAGMAEVNHIEARMHFFQGDFVTAIHIGEQALALWEATDSDPRGMIRTLNLLAVAAIEQKMPDQAEQYGQRSLSLAEQLQDKGEQAMAFDVLAHVHRLREEFEQAQTAVEKSLALLETIGDLGSQANALFQLCRLHLRTGNSDMALQMGQQSLQLCRTLNHRLLEVYVLNCLGDAHHQLGELGVARQTWQNALSIAQKLNHPRAILNTERRLAEA